MNTLPATVQNDQIKRVKALDVGSLTVQQRDGQSIYLARKTSRLLREVDIMELVRKIKSDILLIICWNAGIGKDAEEKNQKINDIPLQVLQSWALVIKNRYGFMSVEEIPLIASPLYWAEYEQPPQAYGKLSADYLFFLFEQYRKVSTKKIGAVHKLIRPELVPQEEPLKLEAPTRTRKLSEMGEFARIYINTLEGGKNRLEALKTALYSDSESETIEDWTRHFYLEYVKARKSGKKFFDMLINDFFVGPCFDELDRVGIFEFSELQRAEFFNRSMILAKVQGLKDARYSHMSKRILEYRLGHLYPDRVSSKPLKKSDWDMILVYFKKICVVHQFESWYNEFETS